MIRLPAFIWLLFSSLQIWAQQSQVNSEAGLALEGYDPVSYFQEGPVEGNPEITAEYGKVDYRFASRENREAFVRDPGRYLPQYGGWCAYAMGLDGQRVEVDPETYKIKDGRLYLFYNAFLNNTLKKWNAREGELLPMANKNWNSQIKHSQNE